MILHIVFAGLYIFMTFSTLVFSLKQFSTILFFMEPLFKLRTQVQKPKANYKGYVEYGQIGQRLGKIWSNWF